MRRTILTVVVVIVILAGTIGAVGLLLSMKRQPKRVKPRPATTIVQVQRLALQKNLPVPVSGYGSAGAKTKLTLAPRVGGKVVYRSKKFFSGLEVNGPAADNVNSLKKAGYKKNSSEADVLMRLDPEPYQLAVDTAQQRIALLNARRKTLGQEESNLKATIKLQKEIVSLEKQQFERIQELFRQHTATQNEVDVSQALLVNKMNALRATQNQLALIGPRRGELDAELDAARVALRQAKLDLSYTTVRAPVTGRIIDCKVEIGETVQRDQVCGEMYGTNVMEIPVSIVAEDVAWLDAKARRQIADRIAREGIGAKVQWTNSVGEVVSWKGNVTRIVGGLEAQTRTAKVIVAVDNRTQPAANRDDYMPLDTNMYCKVDIIGRPVPEAFIIPRRAILPDGSVYLAVQVSETKSGKTIPKSSPIDAKPSKNDVISGQKDADLTKKGDQITQNDGRYILKRRKIHVARYTNGHAMILPSGGLKPGELIITSYIPKPVEGMTLVLADDKAKHTPKRPETSNEAKPATAK